MKIVITDCSWSSYDVEQKNLPAEAEVVCTQILTEEEVIDFVLEYASGNFTDEEIGNYIPGYGE